MRKLDLFGFQVEIDEVATKEGYKYSDIADFLMHGREIEFVYKERECAITNHTRRWWFYDGVEQVEICEFEAFETLVSKVAEYMVDDRKVQDIFDNGLYENAYML